MAVFFWYSLHQKLSEHLHRVEDLDLNSQKYRTELLTSKSGPQELKSFSELPVWPSSVPVPLLIPALALGSNTHQVGSYGEGYLEHSIFGSRHTFLPLPSMDNFHGHWTPISFDRNTTTWTKVFSSVRDGGPVPFPFLCFRKEGLCACVERDFSDIATVRHWQCSVLLLSSSYDSRWGHTLPVDIVL